MQEETFCLTLQKITIYMALAISSVPVLTGKAAERFQKRIREVEENKKSIDFSKQMAEAIKILSKAKLG